MLPPPSCVFTPVLRFDDFSLPTVGVVVEAVQKSEKARELTLRLNQIPRLLGLELQAEKVVQLLEPLEIRCTGRNEDSLRFETPSFRPDLERERDRVG